MCGFSLFCPPVYFESLTSCRDRMITCVFAKVHEYVKIFLTSTKLPRPLNRFGESCTVSSLFLDRATSSVNKYLPQKSQTQLQFVRTAKVQSYVLSTSYKRCTFQ